MYTKTVIVPRITPDQLKALDGVVPNLTSLVSIPLITNEEEAISHAIDLTNSQISTTEVVTDVIGTITRVDSWEIALSVMD